MPMLPESFLAELLQKHQTSRSFPATSEIKKLFTKIVLTLFPEQTRIHIKSQEELRAVWESIENGLESMLHAMKADLKESPQALSAGGTLDFAGGIVVHTTAGVGALIQAQPALRIGIQVVGVAYLLWLAFKLARAGALANAHMERLDVTFMQGVMLQFVNIKAWMLALTLVSGWLAGREDMWQRLSLLLPAMVAFGFASNLTYALIGSLLRTWLNGPNHTGLRRRWFNRGMAAILVATAAWMATF